ncbi:MAG: hypothetical protein ABJN26_17700 [Stappiaceae bacterium]
MEKLAETLLDSGLLLLAGFHPDPGDKLPDAVPGMPTRTVFLVGNAGSVMWPVFCKEWQAFESSDPLDHWTEQVMGEIATGFRMGVVYPFKGPPYYPFQNWALRAGGVSKSPLGVLVHPLYGPWFAYRGALLSPNRINLSVEATEKGPCDTCEDKPCLNACPAGAVSLERGYDVPACRAYLKREPASHCQERCNARLACPFGKPFRYTSDHARFHMEKFLAREF